MTSQYEKGPAGPFLLFLLSAKSGKNSEAHHQDGPLSGTSRRDQLPLWEPSITSLPSFTGMVVPGALFMRITPS